MATEGARLGFIVFFWLVDVLMARPSADGLPSARKGGRGKFDEEKWKGDSSSCRFPLHIRLEGLNLR